MSLKVLFQCENDGREVSADAEAGETLVQVAARAKVVIQQTCANAPACTDCRVLVKKGLDSGLEAPEGPELRLMGNVFHITRERLACQSVLKGDVTVWVPTAKIRKHKP